MNKISQGGTQNQKSPKPQEIYLADQNWFNPLTWKISNLQPPNKFSNTKKALTSQASIYQASASGINSSTLQDQASVSQVEEIGSSAEAYQQFNSTQSKRLESTHLSTRSQVKGGSLNPMNRTTSSFAKYTSKGFQRVQLQAINNNSSLNSHHNSVYQTIKDSQDGNIINIKGGQINTLDSYGNHHSSSQLKVKMLKRYSLKSKASTVLQRIGFPQKKYKIQEDLRKIKKEIGAKMEDENQEFFELLNATSQSFFEQLNESMGETTFYGAGNSRAQHKIKVNEYGYQSGNADTYESDANLFEEGLQRNSNGNSRPITELKARSSMLCPPPQLNIIKQGKSTRDKTLDQKSQVEPDEGQWDFNNLPTRGTSTNVHYSRNNNTNLSFLNPSLNTHEGGKEGQMFNDMRPQTSQLKNGDLSSLNDMSSFINQKIKSQVKLQPGSDSGTSTMNRPITNLKNIPGKQNYHQKLMNKTAQDFRKFANTTLESTKLEYNPSKLSQPKAQFPLSRNFDVSQQNLSQNEYSDFQSGLIRDKAHSNERKAFMNQTINSEQGPNSLDSSSIFLLQQIDKKPQNSRASFKRSRHEALQFYGLNHQLSTIELQFEAIRYALSGSDNLLRIKFLIVQSYEIICYPQISLEMRKTSLVDAWGKLIAEIKQSDELSTAFDLLFHTQKALGDIYMDFKDLVEAVRVFKSLKILCEDFQRYQEKMFIYQQIGYVYRIMKDNESAVKQFKKQLQLAWQEGDTQMEVNAYDNLSLEYFYLGELSKANYYNDRIMRGKTENNKSIVKKVSCNLLVSRREHRHNLELRKAGEKQKVAIEHQRLPSPSAINKGTQFSKAINLLPYYTESQALGIKEEEDEDDGNLGGIQSKAIKKAKSQERKFTQKELLHLNKPPPYEYLKPQKDSKHLGNKNYLGVGASRNGGKSLEGQTTTNQGYEVNGVYRQEDPVDYKPFDEDRFRDIVTYALQKKETSHTTDDKRNLSHLSVHRTAPLNIMHPQKMIENLKKIVEDYVAKLVQLAMQDKLLKQKDQNSKKDSQLQQTQSIQSSTQ